MIDLDLKVKIKNNKTGEEKTESTIIHLETFIQNSLDYDNLFRFGNVFLQGLFKNAMHSMNIKLCDSDEAKLLDIVNTIDRDFSNDAIYESGDRDFNISDYTFTICGETFETIETVLFSCKLRKGILALNKNADKVTELVNYLDYNSKGKSYNIACELESVNFLLERILKEYDAENRNK